MGNMKPALDEEIGELEKISHRSGHHKADVFIRSKYSSDRVQKYFKILRGDRYIIAFAL
jgi:hypothetical protein